MDCAGETSGRLIYIIYSRISNAVSRISSAKYAFDFQRNKEAEAGRRSNVVNGNNVIFSLMRMTATLISYRKTVIDPIRDETIAFIIMKPTLQELRDDIKLNVERLYFLLETPDPNLLNEIMAVENSYRYLLDAINERSRIHDQEVQPAMERAGITLGVGYTVEQIKAAIGPRLYLTLKQSTEHIISQVNQLIPGLKDIGDKLGNTLKRLYPHHTIINFLVVEDNDRA